MAMEYLVRHRNDDGSWTINEEEVWSKEDAENIRKVNRVMFGITSQIWSKEEWMKSHIKPNQ